MTHCLAAFLVTWRYQPGKGKVWIALDRATKQEVARSKRRKICCATATRRYANTHNGLRVV